MDHQIFNTHQPFPSKYWKIQFNANTILPGFLRCADRRLDRGLRKGSSRHMREGRRGGEGLRQVRDQTEAGRGGVGSVTVCVICAVLGCVMVLILGCDDEIWYVHNPTHKD